MPQLDKSSYSDIHYVERSNLPNASIPVDVKKFSPVSGDILTSSAWSAVIHHPAEDSEPEDLPSTVDMDAIKGSPTTSLPTSGPMGWSESDRGQGGGGNEDSDSGDEDDDDEDEDDDNEKDESSSDNESSSPNSDGDDADSESGTAHGSASDSDSESSSKNSYDSDSDSASSDSSCSSRSSGSSHSSPSPTPVRESEKNSSSQQSQLGVGPKSRVAAHRAEKGEEKGEGVGKPTSKEEGRAEERRGAPKKDDGAPHRKESSGKDERQDQRKEAVRTPSRAKVEADEERREKAKDLLMKPSPLRAFRRRADDPVVRPMSRPAGRAKGSSGEVSSSSRAGLNSLSSSVSPRDAKSCDNKKMERKASTVLPSSSVQHSSTVTSVANDSSSDMELPAQLVNDAIKRIQVESKSKSGPHPADVEEEIENEEQEESSDEGDHRRGHYSSSLLQKFVENTERISGKRNALQAGSSGSKHGNLIHKESARPRHPGHYPSTSSLPVRSGDVSGASARTGPADLEVYCSVSNVSPDSGIYCVAGSPWHQSSPAHSPQHPPQQLGKGISSPPRGINSQDHRRKHISLKVAPASSSKSSPKKSSTHVEHHKDARVPPITLVDDSDETTCSSPLLPAPARRGRGRPKKNPPILEPCLPYSSKSLSKHSHSSDRAHNKHNKSRKQMHPKESESSDQSVERCDKILTYSKHRSREVQVTSQGVQCDQSEFPQIQLPEVKKKKNQACQSYQASPPKPTSLFKPSNYSGQRKEKVHRKAGKLQTVCDRVKKSSDSYSYGHGPVSQSKKLSTADKDAGLFRRLSHGKQDSPSPSCSRSSSSSKCRIPTGVEKKKKGRRREPAASLAAAAAVLLSSSSTAVVKPDPVSLPSQPGAPSNVRPSKTQRPVEKVVALPKALKPHKHQKHHRRKGHKRRPSHSRCVDPRFLEELEKLITDFQRSCCIARIQQPSRLSEGTRLPSIFRVKRILKKRKGSERSKNSDRDSGPEADNTNPPVTPAARDSRDKGSTGGKRRPKKSAVETPKGQRPEANNEQRLPLKKRHYHVSSAPNQQSGLSSSPEMSLDVSSSAEDKKSNNDDSPTSSTSSKASVMSIGSQGSRGNSSVTTLNVQSKAAAPTVNESSLSPNAIPSIGKSTTPPSICNSVNNPRPSFNRYVLKGGAPSPSSSSSEVVVMPATSSSPYDFVSNGSTILSKADSSASFASVCGKDESLPGRISMTNLEKTLSTPLAVACTNRLYGSSSPNSRNSPRASSPTGVKSAVSVGLGAISTKSVQGDSDSVLVAKSNGSNSSALKGSSSKSGTNPVVKTLTAANAPVKSVADSSLLMTKAPMSDVHRGLSSVHSSQQGTSTSTPITSSVSSVSCGKSSASAGSSSNFAVSLPSSSKSSVGVPVCDGKLIRNSYDDAIEACITKYSSDVPSVNLAPRSVITTPKKRHRMEMQGKQGVGKGKEIEASVHSTTSSTMAVQAVKKSNLRSTTSAVSSSPVPPSVMPISEIPPPFVQTKLSPPPAPQAFSPGGSKLPESGIFEPSSSSEHYVVDVSLPATPVKSAIAGLSKLKTSGSGTSFKGIPTPPTVPDAAVSAEPSESFSLTSHNLRQKKNLLSLPLAEAIDIGLEDSTPTERSSTPSSLTGIDICKTDLDVKTKMKTKAKAKQVENVENTISCERVLSESEVKTEETAVLADTDAGSSDLKELRIHVEKLDSVDGSHQKDKQPKQLKNHMVVPKRRRKCNRTGFPVKRKKKKKESFPDDVKVEEDSVKLEGDSAGTSTVEGIVLLKEEVVDDGSSAIKIGNKRESQAVILKTEDCVLSSRDAKDVKPSLENHHNVSAHHDDSSIVPYTDRLPNTEKYMFAGFTKRLDPKMNTKVRKPSKAVIRAMRAKFSENIPLPDLHLSSASRGTKPVPSQWSSDDSDDSINDPYEFTETPPPSGPVDCDEAIKSDNSEDGVRTEEPASKPKNSSMRKRPKRVMKRPAVSLCEDALKSKCAKSEKEGSETVTVSTIKPTATDSRTRAKRKNDGDEVSGSVELRHTRVRKRPRTVQKMDADSQDSDCDDVDEPPPPNNTGPTGDALSEDETSKTDLKDTKQPRWRKKYLPAGLFSDYFKLDEPRPVGDSKKGLQYKPEDHPHGLLPPPYHCGKWLRQRRVNFQLPYDLWWLHTHNKLPGRDIVPSWNYKKLRTNVYNNVKPSYVHEPQSCNCKMPESDVKGCGDDCINRLVYTECAPSICPVKDRCANQKIQRHDWAPGLERFMTKEKGWGVRAKLPIKSGEFILEYVGEVVSDKEFKERMATIYTKDTHHYCLHLDGGLVIDGHRMGGDGRFVNHSCEPNCEMQKWSVNGLFRMALFALRDIEANEELGYDYNFSLFNAAEGQPCKCGSSQCRGVIGGKSQRVNVLPSNHNGSSSKVSVKDISEKKGSRKCKRKASRKNDKEQAAENMRQRKRIEAQRVSQLLTQNIRQMSHQQRCFVQHHHCFLLRNLEKVRRLKEKLKQATQRAESFPQQAPPNVKQSDVFLTQLNALSIPRNVRTRRLAQAEDNPELARNARLACVLRDLYNVVVSAKDEKGEALSTPFMTLPNKRKLPLYYVRIREPLDFSTVEQNINSGLYCTLEAFDHDVNRILNNNLKFYGRTTNVGIASVRLKKIYVDAKKEAHPQLVDVLGETLPASFIAEKNPADEEDVIRCICGLYRDEGLMIQCERCLVWQHCDCVKADSSLEHYLCEICQPRSIDLEIPEIPVDTQPCSDTPDGQIEFVTLLRSDLQIRKGDTVYVLRDVLEGEGDSLAKVTYKTIKDPKYGDMDIFRIERLWKDKNGERFAYGHHYLRPHETYHEPTRKFYPNEVMRVPLYEIISLDLIWARCWVLDPMTYCKGRPIEAVEEHVYICEYRVDKSAHLFYKISKSQSRANICMKSYAFETFETRLKPVRTYTPHGTVPPLKPRVRGNQDDASSTKSMQQSQSSVTEEEEEVPLARREKQRSHLNGILLRLLSNQQCKQPLDMSYLLDPGRRPRKKPVSLNT